MKKSEREQVFNKFGGRCAYCGCELTKGWHVDEIEPVRRHEQYLKNEFGDRIWDKEKHDYVKIKTCMHPERFHIDNQNPACASCNINKHSDSLEDFRRHIAGYMNHLNNINTQFKIAKRYGLVVETGNAVVFYFETLNQPRS